MTDLYVRGGTDPAFVVAVTRADGSPVDLTDPAVRAWFTARDPVSGVPVMEATLNVTGGPGGIQANNPTTVDQNQMTIVTDLSGFDRNVRLPYDVLIEETDGSRDVNVSGWIHVWRAQSRPPA